MRRTASALLAGILLLCFCTHEAAARVIEYLSETDEKPALFSGTLPEDWLYSPMEVHFINVGSADSILIRSGEWTMLVDSGLAARYERIVEYLRSIGVDHLDYAFGSHPHDDHIGGFPGIFDEIPVGIYLEPGFFEDVRDEYTAALHASLLKHQIPRETIKSGEERTFSGVSLSFFQWEKPSAFINNRSMAVRLECGDRSVLLAADLESHGQKALASAYGARLKSDILKFPHHGLAGFAFAFYRAVQPELVTISNIEDRTGRLRNDLKRKGIPWMLTTQGTIIAYTDGGIWKIWQLEKNVRSYPSGRGIIN